MLDLRAITDKRTAPGTWRAKDWGPVPKTNIPDWAVLADGAPPYPAVVMRSFGSYAAGDDAAAIVAMDHTYEALLAVAEAAEKAHSHIETTREGDKRANALLAALAALDARIAEVTK